MNLKLAMVEEFRVLNVFTIQFGIQATFKRARSSTWCGLRYSRAPASCSIATFASRQCSSTASVGVLVVVLFYDQFIFSTCYF